ncbi:hypothetical protein GGD46_001065 [Rhizobium lusitanum]|uniref:Uncharacterized protein n=1 Tax=Rhizobium lusitanum TaxID=293958 RepID=A0A7X0IMN2_9HYPH|nr:hypothetical protein [Rhizobium lusitanum]
MSMNSDKQSLEVDSRTWTGIGLQSENLQPSVANRYLGIDNICLLALWWSLVQVVFHLIEQLASGKFSPTFAYLKSDIGFYIFYISLGAIAFLILFLRKMPRDSKNT